MKQLSSCECKEKNFKYCLTTLPSECFQLQLILFFAIAIPSAFSLIWLTPYATYGFDAELLMWEYDSPEFMPSYDRLTTLATSVIATVCYILVLFFVLKKVSNASLIDEVCKAFSMQLITSVMRPRTWRAKTPWSVKFVVIKYYQNHSYCKHYIISILYYQLTVVNWQNILPLYPMTITLSHEGAPPLLIS